MIKNKIKITIFTFIEISALILGGLIYWLFREKTYISKLVSYYIDGEVLKQQFGIFDSNFLKYYFVDYLWALSLSCGLHSIFLPEFKTSLKITFIVFIFGIIYEILQKIGNINGTGDIIDILLYLLAGITTNLINYILTKREKTK